MIYVCFHTTECISTNLGYIACCSVRFIPLDCSGLLGHNAFAGFVLASNFSLQTAYLELLNSLQPPSYCSTCTVTTHFHIMQWITILQSFKYLRASISINNARINLFFFFFTFCHGYDCHNVSGMHHDHLQANTFLKCYSSHCHQQYISFFQNF